MDRYNEVVNTINSIYNQENVFNVLLNDFLFKGPISSLKQQFAE